ncbi:MAG: IS200/IS605 family transposase [Myxococcales bacterium]|nr:IS200/IS605 family transposase [Myxococcales bacterium]
MHNKIDVFVHFVWGTSGRAKTMVGKIERTVKAAVATKCSELRSPALAIGGTDDHMHLLVRLHPTVAVARLVGEVKGASSFAIAVVGDRCDFGWQAGYGAFSVSADDVRAVESYVLNQRQHHAHNAILTELETTGEP